MTGIAVPDFFCPLPSGINPHVGEAEKYALQWALDNGLIRSDDAWGIGLSRIGYLASRASPDASPEALRIIVEWLDWLLVYDDSVLDKRANVSRLDGEDIVAFQRRVTGILSGDQPAHESSSPLLRSFRVLRESIRRCCPHWEMADFIQGFHRYLQANLWEATNIWLGRPPGLAAYTGMRRHTGCLFPTYLLSAAINGIGITDEARNHVAIQQLEIMANNYTCWLNDVCSFEREQRDGQVNNLVAVLRNERGYSVQQAIADAIDMCRIEMESYLELKDRLPRLSVPGDPAVPGYLGVLESWMRALLDWHQLTGRYGANDTAGPE
ncbi:MAG: hypothetical protein J2P32_07070 [Actinobacteria bacterium]|nr:hypothetical protein [Actinomycetota bacterium]